MTPISSSRLSLYLTLIASLMAGMAYPAYLLAGSERGPSAIAVGLVLGGAVGLFLSLRLALRIDDLAKLANLVGDGNFERRLEAKPGQILGPLAHAINLMAERIGDRARILAREQSRTLAVLDAMSEGVMICDGRGRVTAVNRAMRGLFPAAAEFEGKRPIEIVSSPELQNACEAILAKTESDTAPVRLAVEGFGGTFYEVGLARLTGPESGLVAVFHDLTLCRKLENVSRDLVANVTHELRTPLTSIKGYAETLLDEPGALTPHQAKFVEVIRRNADHMTLMTADLLTLSRMENDREPPLAAPTDLDKALSEAWRECAKLAKDKQAAIEFSLRDFGADKPVLSADSGQLVQVLRNLLENAIRHAPEGSKIGVEAARLGKLALIGVSDMGPGVPPADRLRVFERFYRVEKHRAKSGGGTGLGLAIAKHIVERHGGQISVEAAGGEYTGAAFRFTWPLSASQGEARDPDTD